jgi:manganese transport protein
MTTPSREANPPQRRGFASVVLWSVIPAAFIGPGTVTSCLIAGQAHGTTLLWTMTFSVLACVLMQTAAARVAACSGRELAAAMRMRYPPGLARRAVSALIVIAIGVGCAAYQAGNVIGASVGLELLFDWPREVRVGLIGVGAATLLFCGVGRSVKAVLSGFVAVMGITFLIVAFRVAPAFDEVVRGSFVPVIPDGGLGLVLALVGTTIVPYNLFLGSSLAIGKDPRDARFGIAVAVAIGGIISAGILVAGAVVSGEFSFANVAAALESRLGGVARTMFAIGLFAAGFTSAVTAPLAAALTIDALARQDGALRLVARRERDALPRGLDRRIARRRLLRAAR